MAPTGAVCCGGCNASCVSKGGTVNTPGLLGTVHRSSSRDVNHLGSGPLGSDPGWWLNSEKEGAAEEGGLPCPSAAPYLHEASP